MSLRPQWFDHALCAGKTHMFIPARGENHLTVRAKKLCAVCVVQPQCFKYSIKLAEQFDLYGMWAGYSRNEREGYMYEHGIPISRSAYDQNLLKDQ